MDDVLAVEEKNKLKNSAQGALDGVDNTKTLMAIESSIKMNMAKQERVKEELKPVIEMLKDFLAGDEKFAELTETAKRASKDKAGRKRELMDTPNGKELDMKLTSLKESSKEAQEALSDFLREYQRLTGLNEFEGEDGELRKIVYIAKLVRKTNLNR